MTSLRRSVLNDPLRFVFFHLFLFMIMFGFVLNCVLLFKFEFSSLLKILKNYSLGGLIKPLVVRVIVRE